MGRNVVAQGHAAQAPAAAGSWSPSPAAAAAGQSWLQSPSPASWWQSPAASGSTTWTPASFGRHLLREFYFF